MPGGASRARQAQHPGRRLIRRAVLNDIDRIFTPARSRGLAPGHRAVAGDVEGPGRLLVEQPDQARRPGRPRGPAGSPASTPSRTREERRVLPAAHDVVVDAGAEDDAGTHDRHRPRRGAWRPRAGRRGRRRPCRGRRRTRARRAPASPRRSAPGCPGRPRRRSTEEVTMTCSVPAVATRRRGPPAQPLTSMSYIWPSSRIGLRMKARWIRQSISLSREQAADRLRVAHVALDEGRLRAAAAPAGAHRRRRSAPSLRASRAAR